MAKLTRDLYIPYLDANTIRKAVGQQEVGSGYDWVRIDKSTIFDLAFNPQEETYGYIDTANDTTFVKNYQPELPEEIILDNENKLYKVMHDFVLAMPTGSNCEVPLLLVTPDMETGKPTVGRMWEKNIVSPGDLNTVDGVLSFSNKLNGDVSIGTVSIEDGTVTFSPMDTGAMASAYMAGNTAPVMPKIDKIND